MLWKHVARPPILAVASGRPSLFWWGDNPGAGTIVVLSLP